MLYSLADLRGYTIDTGSEPVGAITDFVFHEDEWTVRYIVVDLEGIDRQVLIAPRLIDRIDEEQKTAWVSATPERIRSGPTVDPDLPISRQLERDVHDYFDWPYYWEDEKVIPTTSEGDLTAVPLAEMEADLERQQAEMASLSDDGWVSRLHRFSRAAGFRLTDRNEAPAGTVSDFIIDDALWNIFYCIVSANGREVLVSPSLIKHIDWEADSGFVDLDRDTVASSPDFELATLRREAGSAQS